MAREIDILEGEVEGIDPFITHLDEVTSQTLDSLSILQVNVGRRCNLACNHCHLEAGPLRDELMSKETMEQVLQVAVDRGFVTIDVTGGAPEMNPNLEWFLREAVATGKEVMVRSNLVILDDPAYAHYLDLYAELGVTVVASLPHYLEKPVNKQRGDESFSKIIKILKKLNDLGYGKDEDKTLNLVYNPQGAFLPPDQASLELEYKQHLADEYGIVFNNLFAITNNPIGRFGHRLEKTGNFQGYMDRLTGAFNPQAVPSVMCRNQLSVDWDGQTYDCDFNIALGLHCENGYTIADYANDPSLPLKRDIVFANHCYACTAGAGSSCGGTTA